MSSEKKINKSKAKSKRLCVFCKMNQNKEKAKDAFVKNM